MALPNVSLVVPCYNEEAFIEQILFDIQKQDFPMENIELFIVDGRSTDQTRAIFDRTVNKLSYKALLLDNEKRIAPVAMNIGIQAAAGDYIFIWGAHASYPPNFISNMIALAEESSADCVGAVCETIPRGSGLKAEAIAEVLQHKAGVGNSSFRTGVQEVTEVDTVAFGCYRKDSFEKFGLFDPRLVRNQDIELNKRIVNQGGKILLDPKTSCSYFARSTFSGLWKNNFGNGKWVVLTAKYTGQFQALSIRHFIPLIFVLGFMLCSLFALNNHLLELLPAIFTYLSLVPVGLYLLIISIASLQISWQKNNLKLLPFSFLSFLCLHFSYGLGSLKGLHHK